jgi:hypothetical protein
MLEEWDLYWKNADITGPKAAVLYENGHGLRSLDSTIGWEASVAWRFLHRIILERNMGGVRFDSWFRYQLPENASNLTMEVALMVMKRAMLDCNRLKEAEELSLFVGIDEYQKIADLTSYFPLLSNAQICSG